MMCVCAWACMYRIAGLICGQVFRKSLVLGISQGNVFADCTFVTYMPSQILFLRLATKTRNS